MHGLKTMLDVAESLRKSSTFYPAGLLFDSPGPEFEQTSLLLANLMAGKLLKRSYQSRMVQVAIFGTE